MSIGINSDVTFVDSVDIAGVGEHFGGVGELIVTTTDTADTDDELERKLRTRGAVLQGHVNCTVVVAVADSAARRANDTTYLVTVEVGSHVGLGSSDLVINHTMVLAAGD